MNWKFKAAIQVSVDRLPLGWRLPVYYWLQRHLGNLKSPSPIYTLTSGAKLVEKIVSHNYSPQGKIFLEIGSGWRLNLPIALWLCGAGKTITVDSNLYLKLELIQSDLNYMREHQNEIENIFSHLPFNKVRWENLLSLSNKDWTIKELLPHIGVHYLAPADASLLALESHSIDYHLSHNVLEHVTPAQVHSILGEGARLLKKEGLALHRVDFSDHFSHSDSSLSPIHFLRYDRDTWNRLAGNRFMYMNRLRLDDFEKIFEESGWCILHVDTHLNEEAVQSLENSKFKLHPDFAGKEWNVLGTTNAWFVAKAN